MDALEGKARVFHFQNGQVLPGIEEGKILLDIGAADADYLFSKRNLKYIIVTEDKVDNVLEKKEYLKKFALANGLNEEEFVLHSYESSTKVDFAKILKDFVAKQIPGIEVIVHIDRDQRPDSDPDLIKLKQDCEKRNLKLFVTKFSEIENYFCQAPHIQNIYKIEAEKAIEIYQTAFAEMEDEAKRKISNFILRERPHLGHNKDGNFDIAIIQKTTEDWYSNFGEKLSPGKELLGKIKVRVQEDLKDDPNEILKSSAGLRCEEFQSIFEEKSV